MQPVNPTANRRIKASLITVVGRAGWAAQPKAPSQAPSAGRESVLSSALILQGNLRDPGGDIHPRSALNAQRLQSDRLPGRIAD